MLILEHNNQKRRLRAFKQLHVRNEVKLKPRLQLEDLRSLQTEEERGEGPFCLPLSIENSSNITVANHHSYRVVSSYQPFLNAIHITNSHDIRLRNIHVYGDNKVSFDNAVIVDAGGPQMVRNREVRRDDHRHLAEGQQDRAKIFACARCRSEAGAADGRVLQHLGRSRSIPQVSSTLSTLTGGASIAGCLRRIERRSCVTARSIRCSLPLIKLAT